MLNINAIGLCGIENSLACSGFEHDTFWAMFGMGQNNNLRHGNNS
jgi:hypothetical protein